MTLAESVIARDNQIDDAVIQLDEHAITILARQSPVAKDLRIVVSALRISSSLERMGDMAEHLAQLARYRFPEKVVPKTIRPTFKEMGALDIGMANMLVDLLRNGDTDLAQKIRDEDDKVDAFYDSIFRNLVSHMVENPSTISSAAQLLFVGGRLNVGSNQVFGSYSGLMTVTVEYN